MLIVQTGPGNGRTFRRVQEHPEGVRRAIRHFFFWQGRDLKAAANEAVNKGPHTGRPRGRAFTSA